MRTRDRLKRAVTHTFPMDDETLTVRRLTGADLEILAEMPQTNQAERMEAARFVCACCLCEPDGQRVYDFSRDETDLRQLDAKVLLTVIEEAMHFSGVSDAAQEELKKNSETTAPTNSGAFWPLPSESPPSNGSSKSVQLETLPSGEPTTNMIPGVESGGKQPS